MKNEYAMWTSSPRARRLRHSGSTFLRVRQAGFTLVELMVALAIGLVIVLAATAALLSAQRGYASVDSSSQLGDNARFAVDLVQRLALQAGYQDLTSSTITRQEAVLATGVDPAPDVTGFNNAVVTTASLPTISNNSRNGACGASTDTKCANGSDVLVLRFYGSSDITPGTADGSMINCAGQPETALTGEDLNNRAYSIFYVAAQSAVNNNEPTLMCAYRDTAGVFQTVPLVDGVESFQVLYGLDGVALDGTVGNATGIPSVWLRADQITTNAAWRRVRRVRIGMLLRGPANAAVDRAGTAKTYQPLGAQLASVNDAGTNLTVAAADGRVRRTAQFTLYLRNPLNVK